MTVSKYRDEKYRCALSFGECYALLVYKIKQWLMNDENISYSDSAVVIKAGIALRFWPGEFSHKVTPRITSYYFCRDGENMESFKYFAKFALRDDEESYYLEIWTDDKKGNGYPFFSCRFEDEDVDEAIKCLEGLND